MYGALLGHSLWLRRAHPRGPDRAMMLLWMRAMLPRPDPRLAAQWLHATDFLLSAAYHCVGVNRGHVWLGVRTG